jgi:hypothetical protein
MELVLTKNDQNQVTVTCDGQPSHTFFLTDLLPQRQDEQLVLTDPVETGARLFAALFADGSPARAAWDARPKRILLVAEDPDLDAIPWEYLRGPDGFVVLDAAFARGLPAAKRQPASDLTGTPLHIVAIPSNPIDHDIARLDIAGEWTRPSASSACARPRWSRPADWLPTSASVSSISWVTADTTVQILSCFSKMNTVGRKASPPRNSSAAWKTAPSW